MMTCIDLFAGIGGFSIGLERTGGFRTAKFCEKNPYAQKVLAKNWPGVPCHDDVTTYEFHEGEADVVTAGFPCQDISYAGMGAGLAGERSGLYREVVRAIRLVRPKFAILENVAALLGRGLDVVLGDMAEIGHDTEWHCIPASAVGAPHRRDRIWIVTHPGGEQHEGDSATLSGTLAAELYGAVAAEMADTHSERAEHAKGYVGDAGRTQSKSTSNHGCPTNPECRATSERGVLGGRGSDLAYAHSKGELQPCGPLEEFWGRLGDRGGEICHSDISRLAVGEGFSGNDGEEQPAALRADWWSVEPDVGRVAHGVRSRVDRLTCLGNAVVPKIPEVIGRAILASQALMPEVAE